jgi:hypothetical protein
MKNIALTIKKKTETWALVAHTCNCTYSEGIDREDHDLKPVQANNLGDHISTKLSTKKG